jgi:hypothetical protein
LLPRKVFDFLPDDADTALVGGVELEDSRFDQIWAVELFGKGEDGASFACAGRTIEEHVWEVGGLEGPAKDGHGVVLGRDIV